jgi:hypothetical protein
MSPAMPQEPAQSVDSDEVVARLRERVAKERAAGAYGDDLSEVELEPPGIAAGFDLDASGPRVRFRPELGFSSKPVIGHVITVVKRFYLRLLLHVFDDLARQTDQAIARVESALAVEVATRERLERDLRELETRVAGLERERKGAG